MFKKSLFVLLIVTLILVLLIPATALADDSSAQPTDQQVPEPPVNKELFKNLSSFSDPDGPQPLPDTEGEISAMALSSVGPSKLSVSLPHYTGYVRFGDFTYKAPYTGFYTYYTLTNEDTDIYFFGPGDEEAFDYDERLGAPFSMWVYLEKDVTYMIRFVNYGKFNEDGYTGSVSSSFSYLRTLPKTLGTQAVTMTSNGYSKNWNQAFSYNVSAFGLHALHITCPASCEYYVTVYRFNSYSNYELIDVFGPLNSETFKTMVLLDAGRYLISCHLRNNVSASHTYTIGMDTSMIETTGGMSNGVSYKRTLDPNDTFTSHNFIPEETGVYRFACDRTDTKLTVTDGGDNVIVKNVPSNSNVPLTGGEDAPNYYVYFTTPASTAKRYINYSATLLSPISTLSSLGASAGDLVPDWGVDPNNDYTLSVDPDEYSNVTITPVPDAPGGTMLINNTARSSITIPISAGMAPQNVTIDYTSPDGENTSTYNVYVRAKSVECSLTDITTFTLGANGRVGTAIVDYETSTLQVLANVSDGATWELLGDDGETPLEFYTMELAEGLNRAFFSVTSENGKHTTVYPLYAYRSSESTEPVIFAYDSEYKQAGSGKFTNKNIYVFALGTPDISAVVKKDGNSADWSDPFTAEGSYEINAFSGNGLGAGPFQFTIDKTPPALTVVDSLGTAVAKGAVLNRAVTVSASDNTEITFASAKDGAVYPWPEGGVFTESGIYYITATDEAGNSTSYAFTIDVSAPTVKAACGSKILDNGGHANGTVVVTVTDPRFKSKSVKKNGGSMSWPSGGKFTYAGVYTVTAYDTFNNKATFTFTIDKTKPSVIAKYSGKYTLYTNRYTKYNVTVYVKDTYLDTKTVTRGGEEYAWPVSSIFTEDGKYVVTAKDKSGNTTTFTFTIDKTLPVITAVSGETELASGANVNTDVTVSYTDTNYSSRYVKKNGYSIKWPSTGKFTASGRYVATVKDKAGNIKTFSFIIDKVKPVISVKTTSGSTVYNGRTTKYDVYVKVTESYLLTKTITLNDVPITWPSTNKFTKEGVYKVNATDRAGNAATTYTFTIDKPARFIVTEVDSGQAIVNKGYANESVTVGFEDQFYAPGSKTLKKGGVLIPWTDEQETITVDDEGVYTVSVKDIIGNTSTFTFTIDKTIPVITAKAYSGAVVENKGISKESRVTIYINEKYLTSKTAIKDGKKISWPSYSRFTYEGFYMIEAVDKAGNTKVFKFTIDRSKPLITCKTVTNKTVANNGVTNQSVKITVTDRVEFSSTLKKDGIEILFWPEAVTEDGVYTISATDELGYSSTFKFTIDTVKPVIAAKDSSGAEIPHCGYSKSNVTVTVTGAAGKSVKKNNAAMTYPSSGVFTAAGTYIVTAWDAAGNKEYLQFTIDKTAPVIAAKVGSTVITSGSFTSGNVTVTVTGASQILVNKDGTDGYGFPEGGLFTEEGRYVVDALDLAGNQKTLIFTIDRTAPVLSAVLTSDMVTEVAAGSTQTEGVSISVQEINISTSTVTVKRNGVVYKKYPVAAGEDPSLLWYPGDEPWLNLTENGEYEIRVTDKTGNMIFMTLTIQISA